ncbi:hypothetical protein EW093_04860 [Thiospirochaeta perfilievii]|uniref:Outer membrane protein beta-barrel domain-containing protein n=1 Tax=Thiospirochaeta perfilievii TaxID=252967 RepID=A0A5C1QB16_9SPIO|nr:hypothetical protein [Thiospirochaeta perfilievii]QEN04059.1 hypothetical protein EW093_04860 [Thiospirochaeta perfilievii]
MKKRIIFLNVIIILLFNSCVTSSNHNRGSLSDALNKAKDDSNDRYVEDEPDNDWYYEEPNNSNDGWFFNDRNNQDVGVRIDSQNPVDPEPFFIIFREGSSVLNGPYFDQSIGGELLFGGSEEEYNLFFYVGLDMLDPDMTNDILEGVNKDSLFMFTGGIELRYYPMNNLKFLSPYILGRLGGALLSFEFKNSLFDGTESIHSDSLGGFTLDAGLGVDIIHL